MDKEKYDFAMKKVDALTDYELWLAHEKYEHSCNESEARNRVENFCKDYEISELDEEILKSNGTIADITWLFENNYEDSLSYNDKWDQALNEELDCLEINIIED